MVSDGRLCGYSVTYWSSSHGSDVAQLKLHGAVLARFERSPISGLWKRDGEECSTTTDGQLPALLLELAASDRDSRVSTERRAERARHALETAGLEVESKVRG